jgi:hypothetical protein
MVKAVPRSTGEKRGVTFSPTQSVNVLVYAGNKTHHPFLINALRTTIIDFHSFPGPVTILLHIIMKIHCSFRVLL